jgi:tetratricopeptide (TPR) repeat protein
MGNVHLAMGQYKKALVSFQKARMIRPGAISPLFFAAVATEKSGELEKAAQLYEHIVEKRPEMVDVAKRYTELLVKTGGAEKAKAFLLRRLKDKRDDSGFTEFMLGKIYLGLNDIDAAKSYFKASDTKNPENPAGFMALADMYKSAGTLEDRIGSLRQAIKHNPEFSKAYVDLASSYLAGGNADQAIGILEEALKTNPDDPVIQNNLASLYLNLNGNDKLARAFELVQDAYQKLAKEPGINDTLGWAYYKKGFLKQAEWYIREAQRLAERPAAEADGDTGLKKDVPIVLYHLGVVLHAKGDDIEAQENLERALATGLEGELQADAQRILDMRLKGPEAP